MVRREVYISGALTNVPNHEQIKQFYEAIGKVCVETGLDPYLPHLRTDPVKHPLVTPREVFENDKRQVSSSDLVIAYVGIASLGVGMELAYAEILDIPIILLYEKKTQISRFPKGIPSLIAEIMFDDYDEALHQLKPVLSQVSEKFAVEVKKLTDDAGLSTNEVHIENNRSPAANRQHFIVKDRVGNILFEGEAATEDKLYLRKALKTLLKKGISPQAVYIDQFSDIEEDVLSIWRESKVLFDYS